MKPSKIKFLYSGKSIGGTTRTPLVLVSGQETSITYHSSRSVLLFFTAKVLEMLLGQFADYRESRKGLGTMMGASNMESRRQANIKSRMVFSNHAAMISQPRRPIFRAGRHGSWFWLRFEEIKRSLKQVLGQVAGLESSVATKHNPTVCPSIRNPAIPFISLFDDPIPGPPITASVGAVQGVVGAINPCKLLC